MARWSSPKDPALEAALRRNRRWIVNNQIKRLLLRFPSRTAPVRLLQSRFKTLDLLGRAANWLRKYPSCFDLFHGGAGGDGDGGEEACFGFTKRMAALVDAEEAAVAASEPAMADRLARVLMLARGRRLQVSKLAALRGPLGLPDDYLLRLLPARTDLFRLANPYPHRRNAAELELLRWVPSLAVSSVEAAAASAADSSAPRFTCSLPPSWAKSHAKIEEFNSTPYISPYSERWAAIGTDADAEKRAVAVVHELLSLTLWKKMSVLKLEHFRREFGLPEDTARMLHRHPCLFYVSNRYKIHTVVLREGYEGSELREKDPVVAAKDRLGELMQEGLHEYNQRRRSENLEKKRRRGEIEIKEEEEEDDEEAVRLDSAEKREERRKFYKVLFNDDNR
ncbi:protein WHAT'S THIS FACTOR 1 homolog, chloroplastic-like isoform X2 [Oryza glaberrima]|uniref:PORR domain-containing protein n=1 Tax=Oryza glaberrima TaxID=4538 RepID=I1Q1E8_ORYGL|nr:protein WHAT'S THIS FACTOR 1 homolog, chloroplastic-like isoform X2 [Oryza glaberrima]XP_052160704.1 protein WHAT'S THIS FACTOR 1 homolog, chloroplastic-like isoform X2 [Oryza glaberrima]